MTAGDEEAFVVGHMEILAGREESLQRPAELDVKPLSRVDGDTNAPINASLPAILHLGPSALSQDSRRAPRTTTPRRVPGSEPLTDEM